MSEESRRRAIRGTPLAPAIRVAKAVLIVPIKQATQQIALGVKLIMNVTLDYFLQKSGNFPHEI